MERKRETTEKAWHAQSASAVLKAVESSREGLSGQEAKRRKETHGPNELPRESLPGWWVIFARQFANPLILILAGAAGVALWLGEFVDAAVIGAALFVNTVIGFVQEYKANRSLEQLRSLVRPEAVVRRDGEDREIPAAEVVPGDILVLAAGDRVAADARLVKVADLQADEAALTGESMPVDKSVEPVPEETPQAERVDMAYAGTGVVAGSGLAVVVATGGRTELGRIATMVSETEEARTPLQDEIQRLARWISVAVIVLVSIVFVIGWLRDLAFAELLETSIATAVATVPEGLVVSITIILAIGAQKMYRRKTLVRRLVATETLGSVSTVCADKTGTLTEGKMQVSEIVPLSGPVDAENASAVERGKETVLILEIGMLCNDASVAGAHDLAKVEVNGSPTERALMLAGLQAGIKLDALRRRHGRIDEVPFSAAGKFMATLNAWKDKRRILVKGAPESVLGMSGKALQGGKVVALENGLRKALQERTEEMARRGLRLLGVAYKEVPSSKEEIDPEKDLAGMVFVGFVALRDPLRPTAKENIRRAREAGVRTVIITGDHPDTALAIAREAGLQATRESVVLGREVEEWSQARMRKRARKVLIYARAEPAHKIRIVGALQANGEVVAMTGDGVNDAPALKAADIGVAVGSGTEVAKQASDIVILDNDLGTITAAIEEGRVMFDNIRKTTVYLLLDSFTEITLIGGALAFGLPLPLLATQILWINLIADTLPAVALTQEPGEPDIMKVPPRPRDEPVLNKEMMTYVFGIGMLTNIAFLPIFAWYFHTTGDAVLARTVMFAAVGLDSLIWVFAVRSFRRSLFRINPLGNPWLLGSVAIGFFLMGLALFNPFLQRIFEVSPLGLSDWGILLIIAVTKLGMIELVKEWFIHRRKKQD